VGFCIPKMHDTIREKIGMRRKVRRSPAPYLYTPGGQRTMRTIKIPAPLHPFGIIGIYTVNVHESGQ